jgi:hypothetical protein
MLLPERVVMARGALVGWVFSFRFLYFSLKLWFERKTVMPCLPFFGVEPILCWGTKEIAFSGFMPFGLFDSLTIYGDSKPSIFGDIGTFEESL